MRLVDVGACQRGASKIEGYVMSDWSDYLGNAEPLRRIFTEGLPALRAVRIHTITMDTSGPAVAIRLDLAEFPKAPPKKWVDRKCNRVQITLLAFGVKKLVQQGLDTELIGAISLSRSEGLIRLTLATDTMTLLVESMFLDISSVSAYQRGDVGSAT